MKANPEYQRLMRMCRPSGEDDMARTANAGYWLIDGELDADGRNMVEPELPRIRSPFDESPELKFVYDEALEFPSLRIKAKAKDWNYYCPIPGYVVSFALDGAGQPLVIFTDHRYRLELNIGSLEVPCTQRERDLFMELSMLVEARNERVPEDDDDEVETSEDGWGDELPEVGDLKYMGEEDPDEDISAIVDEEVAEIEEGIYKILRNREWPVGVIVNMLECGVDLPEAYFYALGRLDQRVTYDFPLK